MPDASPFKTSDTAFVAFLIDKGCEVLEHACGNGCGKTVFQVDLKGKVVSSLEGEYYRSEYHRIDAIRRSLTNRIFGR